MSETEDPKEYRYTLIFSNTYRVAEQKARELEIEPRRWVWIQNSEAAHRATRGHRSFRVVLCPGWWDNTPNLHVILAMVAAAAMGNDECDVSELNASQTARYAGWGRI